MGPATPRVAGALAALATVPIGLVVPAVVQLAALIAVVVGMLVVESVVLSPAIATD